jgi:ADP-heptose:LPS heptosyltransferase
MHTDPPPLFQLLNCQSIVTADLMTWKSVIAAVDYVISIDTAAFHLAGGMKKPLIGIFSWTNGKVYGKHYDFMLVQKHKDCDPDWCGPCNNWQMCPKVPLHHPKPCVAETKANEIMNAFDLLVKNKSKPFAYSLPVIR